MRTSLMAGILGVILSIMLIACGTNRSVVKPTEVALNNPPANNEPYRIMEGDELEVKFFYNPELNETLTVRPDGKISLQLVDEVQASGLTPSELDDYLTEKYAKELRKPVVTVIVRSFSGQRVYVGGEVQTESLITMSPGMTAMQAVFQAGGFLDTAKQSETLVIRKGQDSKPIPIKIDLSASSSKVGMGAEFILRPNDIVFVPKSAIAEANLFVNQYIERLLLFRGVSLGFTYEMRGAF